MAYSTYWKFSTISAMQLFAGSIMLSILTVYFSSLGFSDAWVSAVMGVFPFVMLISSIFVGELGEEVGRSWMIKLALLGTAVAYGLYFFGYGFTIIVGRVLDAFSYTVLTVLILAKIQGVVKSSSRGKMTGLFLSIRDAVRVLGPVAAGYLADVYVGIPFITAIVVLLGAAWLLHGSSYHKKKDLALHPKRSLSWFFARDSLKPMMLLGPVFNGFIPVIAVLLPLLITKDFGLSFTQVGAATSVFMLGHVTQFFFGDLADRFTAWKFIVFGALIMSAAVFSLFFVQSYYALLFVMFCKGIGNACWNVSAWSYMNASITQGHESKLIGTYMFVAKIGETLSFVLIATAIAALGYRALFIVLGSLGFAATIAAWHLFVTSARLSRQ